MRLFVGDTARANAIAPDWCQWPTNRRPGSPMPPGGRCIVRPGDRPGCARERRERADAGDAWTTGPGRQPGGRPGVGATDQRRAPALAEQRGSPAASGGGIDRCGEHQRFPGRPLAAARGTTLNDEANRGRGSKGQTVKSRRPGVCRGPSVLPVCLLPPASSPILEFPRTRAGTADMAGHSKWKQIKHYKAATDKARRPVHEADS